MQAFCNKRLLKLCDRYEPAEEQNWLCCVTIFFVVETSRTKSKHRTEPSDDLKAILRKALQIDIKFYEFVKKRFYRQLDELKKLGRIKKDS